MLEKDSGARQSRGFTLRKLYTKSRQHDKIKTVSHKSKNWILRFIPQGGWLKIKECKLGNVNSSVFVYKCQLTAYDPYKRSTQRIYKSPCCFCFCPVWTLFLPLVASFLAFGELSLCLWWAVVSVSVSHSRCQALMP
jgi:hypothetical protein